MKTIGLIGGMSWESTLQYYRIINETVKQKLGGLHSAKIVMVSVDFGEIEVLQKEDRWDELAGVMAGAAQDLENAGADLFLICTNTVHKVADEIQKAVSIPLLHIADATAGAVLGRKLGKAALLGTKYTMEGDFYRVRMAQKHGIEVMIPDETDRETVHRVIYGELCLGNVNPASKKAFLGIIGGLVEKGAQGVILGCTEIPMLIGPDDVSVPVFDTLAIHARAAVERAL